MCHPLADDGVELPLLTVDHIGSEAALVDTDDDDLVMQELCEQSTDPQSLFVVVGVTVLEIR